MQTKVERLTEEQARAWTDAIATWLRARGEEEEAAWQKTRWTKEEQVDGTSLFSAADALDGIDLRALSSDLVIGGDS